MNNRKFYSFNRNHYYYGKLLTSRDFSMEQEYMNDKRRLGNRMLHGSGIVSGLKVVAADDTAIILQAGFAVDGGGREIVVPETEVVKLATIDGVGSLTSDTAYLAISYQEKAAERVYSALQEDNQESYNHVAEGYALHLYSEEECAAVSEMKADWLTETLLFEDEDYRITQVMSKYLPEERGLSVQVNVEKKRQTKELLSVQYVLNVEGLSGQYFPVELENLKLNRFEKRSVSVELQLKEEIRFLKHFEMKVSDLVVSKDQRRCAVQIPAGSEVICLNQDLLSAVVENSYKTAMDIEIENSYDDRIYLAKLNLIRMGERVLLNHVEEVPFEQYVYSAKQLMLFENLKKFCPETREIMTDRMESAERYAVSGPEYTAGKETGFVTGVFDLSLGSVGEAGKVCYSEEIMHGLGEGPVYVDVAYEILNRENGEAREEIVFGDADLFAGNESMEKQLQISCAVKILPERGTFVVAVKPKNKVTRTSIRIRWYACRVEDTGKSISRNKDKQGMMVIAPDTFTTAPRGVVQIIPRFVNMPEQACSYEVLDAAGGKIDNNGIYTAPSAEGVYEVKVSCISAPEIFAHAYIIVSAASK